MGLSLGGFYSRAGCFGSKVDPSRSKVTIITVTYVVQRYSVSNDRREGCGESFLASTSVVVLSCSSDIGWKVALFFSVYTYNQWDITETEILHLSSPRSWLNI